VQHQIKLQQRSYFENLLKRFWKYIKSRKHDNSGVGTLQSSSGAILNPFKKAELLNEQFQSVFTTSDPHLTHAKDNSPYPTIPQFHITTLGVHKLLTEINSNKAPGPDGIPAQVLVSASEELAPMLTPTYSNSLYNMVQYHPTGDIHMLHLSTRKEAKPTQKITVRFHLHHLSVELWNTLY